MTIDPAMRVVCPCCGRYALALEFSSAPPQMRGPIVLAMHKDGLSPKQIAEVTGWNYNTVRSTLWYQKNVAKVKP